MTVTVSAGLLILRVIAGLTIAAHGSQKLFGWFSGPGFARFAQGFQGQGLKPGWLWTSLLILGELGGGLSLAFGFLTPLGAAGMFGAMVMAIAKSHWKKGFWNRTGGVEFPLQLLAAGVALGIAGPGNYSLDHLFGIAFPYPLLFIILAIVALLVDIVGLLLGSSRPAAVPAPAPATGETTTPASESSPRVS